MLDLRRKYSTEFSRSRVKSINNRFLWCQDSTYNMYASIGTWNLCLNRLVSDLTKEGNDPT